MKNLKLVFALIAFIYVQFASGATWTDADGFTWTYSVYDGEATIKGVSPRNGSLSIPKTLGGGTVTKIGREAFDNCRGLTLVTIPDSVTTIDEFAFFNCSGLTSVTIPDSVTSIDYDAFSYCLELKTIYTDCGNMERLRSLNDNFTNVEIIEGYRIAYYSIDGTMVVVKGLYYIPGCAAVIPAQDYKGYCYSDWDVSALAGVPTMNPVVIKPQQCIANHYQVRVVYQDGLHDDETLDCEYGVAYDIIPNRKGYTFLGWARDSSEGDIVSKGVIKNGSSCMTVGGFPPHKFAWPLFYGLLSRSSGPRNFD